MKRGPAGIVVNVGFGDTAERCVRGNTSFDVPYASTKMRLRKILLPAQRFENRTSKSRDVALNRKPRQIFLRKSG
jgi:hypothetical protein